jgi:hypothetical protein
MSLRHRNTAERMKVPPEPDDHAVAVDRRGRWHLGISKNSVNGDKRGNEVRVGAFRR